MASPTYITNPQVNNGTAIRCNGTTLVQDITINTYVPAVPGRDPASTYESMLGIGQNSGVGTDIITLTAVIDTNVAHATGSSAVLDYEYIKSLCQRSDQFMTLQDDAFITSTNLTGTTNVMLTKATFGRPDTSNVRTVTLTFQNCRSS